MHNQPDVTFAQQMIPHHQQAIEMSDILLAKQGIDPRVVDLANKIKSAQGPEIQQMQAWLTQWQQQPSTPGTPTPPTPSQSPPGHGGTPAPTTSNGHGGDHQSTEMPAMDHSSGMMSAQDIAALQNAQGSVAARLFLTQMIQHHQGAISMAHTEIGAGQYPPAVSLAQSIVSSQQDEITAMRGILDSL